MSDFSKHGFKLKFVMDFHFPLLSSFHNELNIHYNIICAGKNCFVMELSYSSIWAVCVLDRSCNGSVCTLKPNWFDGLKIGKWECKALRCSNFKFLLLLLHLLQIYHIWAGLGKEKTALHAYMMVHALSFPQ
jgi:hypothetical protein